MKILFLGYSDCMLLDFLRSKYQVTQTEEKISSTKAAKYDQIISFGYRHIIKPEVLNACNNQIINLHMSYLPYNRGSHPNFWSFVERTPKGVSIHYIDKGIDTGDILLQKKIIFDKSDDTFKKTYDKLMYEIQNLFIDNCAKLLNGKIKPKPQQQDGTVHYKKQLNKYQKHLTDLWDTKIYKITNLKKDEIHK